MEWIEINYKSGSKIVLRIDEIQEINYHKWGDDVKIEVKIKEWWNAIEIDEDEYERIRDILTRKDKI